MTRQRAEPAAVNDDVVVQFLTAKDLKGDVTLRVERIPRLRRALQGYLGQRQMIIAELSGGSRLLKIESLSKTFPGVRVNHSRAALALTTHTVR